MGENLLDLRGNFFEFGEIVAELGGAHPFDLGEMEGEEGEDADLRGEGFGRADADFGTGVEVERAVGFAAEGGVLDVADTEDAGTSPFGFAHGGEGVGRLARLADGDDEGVIGEDRVSVARFGSDLHRGRDPNEVFEEERAEPAGVGGGAAAEEPDVAEVAELFFGEVEVEMDRGGVLVYPSEERFLDRGRLLVDLFEHEMLVPFFGERLELAVDPLAFFGEWEERGAEEGCLGFFDPNDLAASEEDNVRGGRQEGVRIGGDDRFGAGVVVADAEGALARGGENLARVVTVNESKGEGAAKLRENLLQGGEDISLIVFRNEMNDDFGVGFGDEADAIVFEFRSEKIVVFDDAVMDKGDGILSVEMGMGIEVRRLAMSCPAGVADGDVEPKRGQGELFFETGDFPRLFARDDFSSRDAGDAGGVVASIL